MRTVTIIETSRGWLNVTYGRLYKTANGALQALKREDRKDGGKRITVIHWESRTKIGEAVIKVLSSQ